MCENKKDDEELNGIQPFPEGDEFIDEDEKPEEMNCYQPEIEVSSPRPGPQIEQVSIPENDGLSDDIKEPEETKRSYSKNSSPEPHIEEVSFSSEDKFSDEEGKMHRYPEISSPEPRIEDSSLCEDEFNDQNDYQESFSEDDSEDGDTKAKPISNSEKKLHDEIDALHDELRKLKEKLERAESDLFEATQNARITEGFELENSGLRQDIDSLKLREHELENKIDILEQMRNEERKKHDQTVNLLKSEAAEAIASRDEEIERSVLLYQENMSLQKQLADLKTKLQASDLIDVMNATAYIQIQWKNLGRILGVPKAVLASISFKSSFSVTRRHYEVMRYWIVEIGGSWEALVSALKSPKMKLEDLANEIEEEYINNTERSRRDIVTDPAKVSSANDLDKYEIFVKVDWKVLGSLLGLDDRTLEDIDTKEKTVEQCQQAMIEKWINTGQAFWSILVDALEGRIICLSRLADEIAEDNLDEETKKNRVTRATISCPYVIDENEVAKRKEEIKAHLLQCEGMVKGIIFLFGMTRVKGVTRDMENVGKAFTELKFAVLRFDNPTGEYLANFIKAVAEFNFKKVSKFCKKKAFYFAGHGGIDKQKRPYFQPLQVKPEESAANKDVILIRETILSHFQRVEPDQCFIFFFDCCLSASSPDNNEEISSDQPCSECAEYFTLEAPVRCVIAYATSAGKKAIGDGDQGGWWTLSLCRHITEKIELGEVLAKTHQEVMKASDGEQPPHYRSCVGPIFMNGKPETAIKNEEPQSKNILKRYHEDLFEFLSNNKQEVLFLIILFNQSSIVCEMNHRMINRMSDSEAASRLLKILEDKVDENEKCLERILDTLDEVDQLREFVSQMREEAACGEKDTITTDMSKVLKEMKDKEMELERENTDLKNELYELQDRIADEEKKRKELEETALLKENESAAACVNDSSSTVILQDLESKVVVPADEINSDKQDKEIENGVLIKESKTKSDREIELSNEIDTLNHELREMKEKFKRIESEKLSVQSEADVSHQDLKINTLNDELSKQKGRLNITEHGNKSKGRHTSSTGETEHLNDTPQIFQISVMTSPWAVDVADDGAIFVSEMDESCVTVFENGQQRSFGSHGKSMGQYDFTSGVAIGVNGNVFVCDNNANRIQEHTRTGAYLRSVGSKGNGPLQFNIPKGITVQKTTGKLYVADCGNGRIQILNPDLTFSGVLGSRGSKPGEFRRPFNSAFDSNGDLYVTDCGNHRIQKFTAEGQMICIIGTKGSSPGFLNSPVGIAIDEDDMLYITEQGNHRVSIFTSQGVFKRCFGTKGDSLTSFNNPYGVKYKNGLLYVCDLNNNRLCVYCV